MKRMWSSRISILSFLTALKRVLIFSYLQNHRRWKGALQVVCPAVLKAGCSGHIQLDSEQLQDTTASLGQLFQCLSILTCKFLHMLKCLFFAPVASLPVTGHCWEESGSISPVASHQKSIHIDEISLNFLFSRLAQLCQPLLLCQMLQALNHLCGPLLDLFQYVCVFLLLGSPGLELTLQMYSHKCQAEGNGHLLQPLIHNHQTVANAV